MYTYIHTHVLYNLSHQFCDLRILLREESKSLCQAKRQLPADPDGKVLDTEHHSTVQEIARNAQWFKRMPIVTWT